MFTFTIQYTEAMKIAKKLAHSMSNQESRYYLCGVFMHKDGEQHYAVSTDGHMLTRLTIAPRYETDDFPSVIFPASLIKQLDGLKLSAGTRTTATVTFRVAKSRYEIECLGQIAGGKLVDGTYPDYQRVIPMGWQSFTNEYVDTGFSPVYLSAILKAASYDAGAFKATATPVRMFFSGQQPAVLIEAKDPKVLYVLMPMRTELPEHRHTVATSEAA